MIYVRSVRPAVRVVGTFIGVSVGTLFKIASPTRTKRE